MPVLWALTAWGDRWVASKAGPPLRFVHSTCETEFTPTIVCSHCGEPVVAGQVTARPGPGARRGHGTLVLAQRMALKPAR